MAELDARVIGQLSLMQSVLISLPDELTIFQFVEHGLKDIPGVGGVSVFDSIEEAEGRMTFTLKSSFKKFLCIEIRDVSAFSVYEPYVRNFVFMLDVIFDERIQRAKNKAYSDDLELRVAERTAELEMEIAEREAITLSLQESEELFRSSFESSSAGICLVSDKGLFEEVNLAFCTMSGYSLPELTGLSFNDITYPDDREIGLEVVKQLIWGERSTAQFEKRYVKKDGSVFHASISTAIVKNKNKPPFFISHIIDITDKYNARKKMEESEAKYRSLFQNITAGFCLYSKDSQTENYVLEESNPIFNKYFLSLSSVSLGTNVSAFSGLFDAETQLHFSRIVASGIGAKAIGYSSQLDKYFDLWIYFPEKMKVAILVTDVTERINAEKVIEKSKILLKEQNEEYEALNEELNESNNALVVAKERAEESDRLKSAFLANMSHEIRTPMNGVIGFADLIDDNGLSDSKRHHYAQIIKNSSRQLLNIVNDIIDISKIETGQITIDLQTVNVNEILYDLFSFYNTNSKSHNVRLYLTKSLEDSKSEIVTDGTKLKQVLNNLLSNAMKFTHEGCVRFGYEIQDGRMFFFVDDTGIGIPQDQQELVFDRFQQVKNPNNVDYGGTGLGLAIAKAYTEKMNGSLYVKNKEGNGTLFIADFPFTPSNSQLNENISASLEPKGFHVLVVEDEEVNYMYLEEVLSKLPVRLSHAKNCSEARTIFNSGTTDLILMDIKLPDGNGLDLSRELKNINASIPIIAQTAYAMASDKLRAQEAGCDNYVSKPIVRDELLTIISEYLPVL